MATHINALALGLATLAVVFGQPANNRTKFVASDVHLDRRTPSIGDLRLRIIPVHNGLYEIDGATLVDLIGIAYGLDADRILGGPTWLEMDRFAIAAKLSGDTSPEDQKRMLQALLEDRFKLVVHKGTKLVPGYALTGVRKPALRPAADSEPSGCKAASVPGGISIGSANYTLGPNSTITYNCRNTTMEAFAQDMHNMIGARLDPGPVVDQTGLKRAWDFDLSWTLDGVFLSAMGNYRTATRITFVDALDRQLGLELTQRQVPASGLIVDSVNRTPTPNAPDLGRIMPPIPPVTRFEVSSMKPSDPNSRGSGYKIQSGGRFTVSGITLEGIFQFTFPGAQFEKLPKWSMSDRFDIVAKAPANSAQLDFMSLAPPLLALLKDHMKMAYHMEQRPGIAYVLGLAKPGAVRPAMKKADPASRTWCKGGMPPSGSQGGFFSYRLTCQNMTMEQFAAWLTMHGAGLMRNGGISNATGLNGAWDFTLIYDTDPSGGPPRLPETAPPSAGAPTAPDPTTGYSIFEAMQRQLGLKLDTTKMPRPVIVIDHIEEKPIN